MKWSCAHVEPEAFVYVLIVSIVYEKQTFTAHRVLCFLDYVALDLRESVCVYVAVPGMRVYIY